MEGKEEVHSDRGCYPLFSIGDHDDHQVDLLFNGITLLSADADRSDMDPHPHFPEFVCLDIDGPHIDIFLHISVYDIHLSSKISNRIMGHHQGNFEVHAKEQATGDALRGTFLSIPDLCIIDPDSWHSPRIRWHDLSSSMPQSGIG